MQTFDSHVEQIIFGLLQSPTPVYDLIERYCLTVSDIFGNTYLRRLFDCCVRCYKAHGVVNDANIATLWVHEYDGDPVYVSEFLSRRKHVSIADAESSIKTLKHDAIQSKMQEKLHETLKQVQRFSVDKPLSELFDIVNKGYDEAVSYIYDPNEAVAAVGSLICKMKGFVEAGQSAFTGTGFPLYDQLSGGGLVQGGINGISARPGVGKSFYLMNSAVNIALTGRPVLYLDSELDDNLYMRRLISLFSGVPFDILSRPTIINEKQELKKYLYGVMDNVIANVPLHYKYIGCTSMQRTILHCKQFLAENHGKTPAIIYDYLMANDTGELANSKLSETQILGNMMMSLQDLAARYGVPIFMCCQQNRNEDVAMSDRIMWKASVLSSLSVPTPEERSERQLPPDIDLIMTFKKTRCADSSTTAIGYTKRLYVSKLIERYACPVNGA